MGFNTYVEFRHLRKNQLLATQRRPVAFLPTEATKQEHGSACENVRPCRLDPRLPLVAPPSTSIQIGQIELHAVMPVSAVMPVMPVSAAMHRNISSRMPSTIPFFSGMSPAAPGDAQ